MKIVYEDEDLLVVNKPSGMVVNRAATTKGKVTVQDWLYQQGLGKDLDRAGIVHRLDKDTSGLLVVAKNQESIAKLQAQFKKRIVKKEYVCLVSGKVLPEKGKITAPITRNPFNSLKFGVFVGGKEAVTDYQVIGKYVKDQAEYSLVKVKPVTGRTHQIRVHLKHIGFPVVADQWYGGRKTHQKTKQWCHRLFLQAVKIGFKQPKTGKTIRVEVELDQDLKQVLKSMKKA